jgi:hypothetical protein
MPALLMTAAEIAAAEALAAEILVAQQAAAATAAAAAEAVQVANAAQAAQVAQAAQAAQTGQAAQTLSAAQAGGYGGVNSVGTATNSGIQALAQEVGTNTATTGIQTLTPASELEQIRQMASGAENMAQQPVNFLNNSVAGVNVGGATPAGVTSPGTLPVSSQLPSFDATQYLNSTAPGSVAPPVEAATADFTAGTGEALGSGSYASPSAPAAPPVDAVAADFTAGTGEALGKGSYASPSAPAAPAAPPATGLEGLLDKGVAYAEKHPITTGLSAMSAYNMLNQPKPYKKEKYKSTFDSSTYKPYEPTPPDPYRPQYPQYAQGGLADLGGYADYAHGGRMLKGPGDGMSDDIPATIANKQPARLANEEFVIPADVVSHLGNGSSEAGAKALYKMMDRVRQARTGNKKQGKQINPEKFLA